MNYIHLAELSITMSDMNMTHIVETIPIWPNIVTSNYENNLITNSDYVNY